MKKIVVIAAAGKGNRLGAGLPKCLVEVNGHAIFEYLLKAFEWADEIRMVVGYKAEEVIKKVSSVNPKVVFIRNDQYAETTTLQSNFLGVEGLQQKVLFIDGDMIISRQTAECLRLEYEKDIEFVGVARDISEEPVYAKVENGEVIWFDYNRQADGEWANVALLHSNRLEYNKTHFFVQIEKILPLKAVDIERLEVDTVADYEYAKKMTIEASQKFGYWGN